MTSESPKIIPNFLKYYTFTELKNIVTDKNFRWYYSQSSGEPEQYSNLLYYDHQFSEDVTPKLKRILATICTQLGAIAVLRIKINATPKNAPQQDWHTDWQITTQSKTFVLYLNDNDGYTEFKDTKVESKANTAIIFDTDLEHRGVPSTDMRRLVLNINYFEK
tara:strand:- start:8 stop:496 length:489 start_codon:yes stop_codon:yes gene_type:complete